jgi:hypothetical protein
MVRQIIYSKSMLFTNKVFFLEENEQCSVSDPAELNKFTDRFFGSYVRNDFRFGKQMIV